VEEVTVTIDNTYTRPWLWAVRLCGVLGLLLFFAPLLADSRPPFESHGVEDAWEALILMLPLYLFMISLWRGRAGFVLAVVAGAITSIVFVFVVPSAYADIDVDGWRPTLWAVLELAVHVALVLCGIAAARHAPPSPTRYWVAAMLGVALEPFLLGLFAPMCVRRNDPIAMNERQTISLLRTAVSCVTSDGSAAEFPARFPATPECPEPTEPGYVFEYTPGPKDAAGHITAFTLSGRPRRPRRTGVRSFAADASGAIHFTLENRAATLQDDLVP
jgi:hypothetical protein